MAKQRLDQQVVARGLADDLNAAKRLIMTGQVLVDDVPHDKPGASINQDAHLRLKQGAVREYVSRAGRKLAAALDHFKIDVHEQTCLDLGASTGGFTDCLLRRGARKVYAVDVGSNQLDYRLRVHPQVVSLERTHAKNLNQTLIPEPIDQLTVDVSFTSLRYVLPPTYPLMSSQAVALCLFKPQFEANKEEVGPGGVIDEHVGYEKLMAFKTWIEDQPLKWIDQMKSPVKGRDGNQEYMVWLSGQI